MKFLNEPMSFNETVIAITEFIEVAIHTILYMRQVYPPDMFVRRRKYSTPVYQIQHPDVAQYITGALTSFGEELAISNIHRLILVIKHAKTQIPYERFIFGMRRVVEVNEDNRDLGVLGGMSSESLTQYFRSFLVKLNMVETTLGELTDLGDDASFAILMELKNKLPEAPGGTAPELPEGEGSEEAHELFNPPLWVPADIEYTTRGAAANAQLHMIRAVDTGIINVALAVQESDAKINPEKYRTAKSPQEPGPPPKDNNNDPVLPLSVEGSLEQQPAPDSKGISREAEPISKVATHSAENLPSETDSASQPQHIASVSSSSQGQAAGSFSPSMRKKKSVSFQIGTHEGLESSPLEHLARPAPQPNQATQTMDSGKADAETEPK